MNLCTLPSYQNNKTSLTYGFDHRPFCYSEETWYALDYRDRIRPRHVPAGGGGEADCGSIYRSAFFLTYGRKGRDKGVADCRVGWREAFQEMDTSGVTVWGKEIIMILEEALDCRFRCFEKSKEHWR